MNTYNKPNKLIGEKSPYLLQHAYNPVEWYPWGDEAFDRAKSENKPIFLSIGYSTCHWCHVMEHESFEDADTAELMNRDFINIKVDREERPDIDRIYMAAVQAISGSGGWPMSVFIDHNLQPFFGGTYFPPEPSYGRPSFTQVLTQISRLWEYEHHKITGSAQSISDYIQKITSPGPKSHETGQHTISIAHSQIMGSYDHLHGGFGAAPKFPRPSVLNLLFGIYKQNDDKEVLEASLHTLREMARHGMYDHVGGGFHRYSVDREWRVPHFEKMLYDQAQLISSYIDAYLITGDEFYGETARNTLRYVQRDMASPEGGFYSAEDADSLPAGEGAGGRKVEGGFYVWGKQEITEILGSEDSEIFCFIYGIREKGNVVSDPHREFTNKNIFYTANSKETAAQKFNKSPDEIDKSISSSLGKLFEARKKRVRPHLDDKIITAWNGMMVSAFSRAYQAFGDKSYILSAVAGADFILTRLINSDGRLYRRYRDGEAGVEGMLEDYAAVIAGLTDLYEASFNPSYLIRAIELQEKQINLFWDYENKGFYETSGNDKSVIIRMKDYYDGAEPSGNSVSLMNLLRLSHLTDNPSFYRKAGELAGAFSGRIEQSPSSLPQMLFSLMYKLNNPRQIIIAGEADDPDTQEALLTVWHRYDPFKAIILADEANKKALSGRLGILNEIKKNDGRVTMYICKNNTCMAPVTGINNIKRALEAK